MVIGAGLQPPPCEAALVGQIERIGVVPHHVHVLIGEALIRDRLMIIAEGNELILVAIGQRRRMVVGVVQARSDRGAAARLVIIGSAPGAVILQAEMLRRHVRMAGNPEALAIGAEIGRDRSRFDHAGRRREKRTFGDGGRRRNRREDRRARRDDNGAADRVAALADRNIGGEHFDLANGRGIDIGQRRIHVVGAGRGDRHAAEHDGVAVVVEAVNHGKA